MKHRLSPEERIFWRNTGLYIFIACIFLILVYPLTLMIFNMNADFFLLTRDYTAVKAADAPTYDEYPQILLVITLIFGIATFTMIAVIYALIEIIFLSSKRLLRANLFMLLQLMSITGVICFSSLAYQELFSYSVQEARFLTQFAFISYRILYGAYSLILFLMGWEIYRSDQFPHWLGIINMLLAITASIFNYLSANMNLPVNEYSLHLLSSLAGYLILGGYILHAALTKSSRNQQTIKPAKTMETK